MQFLRGPRFFLAILFVFLCCSFPVWSTAANAGKQPDLGAIWLSGAFFENATAAPFQPRSYFLTQEAISLVLVFDYFGEPSCAATVTARMAGKTATGQKYARSFTTLVTVDEISFTDIATDFPVFWFWLGQFPEGEYQMKVSVKGVKPCKGRGNANISIEIL